MSDRVNQVRTFEVLTATAVPSRRSPRHWSDEEKARLVAEAFSPGGTVTGVARSYGLDVSQLYTWRRKALASGLVAPLPGRVRPAQPGPSQEVKFARFDAVSSTAVEIVVSDVIVRVGGDIDPDQLAAIIRAVRQG